MNSVLAFAVRDLKAEGFLFPFFSRTRGMAVRSFGDWCLDTQSPLGRHPEDYMLFQVGFFDEEAGRFENLSAPELLSSGADWPGRSNGRPVAVEV